MLVSELEGLSDNDLECFYCYEQFETLQNSPNYPVQPSKTTIWNVSIVTDPLKDNDL